MLCYILGCYVHCNCSHKVFPPSVTYVFSTGSNVSTTHTFRADSSLQVSLDSVLRIYGPSLRAHKVTEDHPIIHPLSPGFRETQFSIRCAVVEGGRIR